MIPTTTTTGTLLGGAPPSAMPIGRVARAYVKEVRYECLRMLRAPAFAIPFLLLPVPVYLFFGVMLAAPAVAKNPGVANYLFSGFSVFAVMGPALFGAGCVLAVERDAGFLKLKRALPAPPAAYIVAKMAMAMVFAALAMALLLAAAVGVGKISLTAAQLVIMTAVMTIGAIPFAAIGLLIGAYASGSAAPAFANLIFLPMLWLSGLFIPLPKVLERMAVIWPAFHLNQVALGFAGVREFSFVPPLISAAVLLGVTIVCGGLAIRRLARVG
jgi:ABC-2 type transport system permease protein